MKKLKLKAFEQGADEIRTHSLLKNVLGENAEPGGSARYKCRWSDDAGNSHSCVDTPPNHTSAAFPLALVC